MFQRQRQTYGKPCKFQFSIPPSQSMQVKWKINVVNLRFLIDLAERDIKFESKAIHSLCRVIIESCSLMKMQTMSTGASRWCCCGDFFTCSVCQHAGGWTYSFALASDKMLVMCTWIIRGISVSATSHLVLKEILLEYVLLWRSQVILLWVNFTEVSWEVTGSQSCF